MCESFKVTIYITTYNRLNLLKRAVDSVLNQTYSNIELIVVDDYSTDGTQDYLREISNKNNSIKYFLKEKNSGACVSRNIAIKAAQGDYITGLDDDDYFLPNRVKNFIFNIHKDKNADFYFDNILIKYGEDTNVVPRFKNKSINFLKPKRIYAKDLLITNYIGNQVFIKTDLLKKYGGFDESMPMWQDLECWYNILVNSNGYARCLSSYTYVVDISHELDRISNLKKEKVERTFQRFIEKHKLSMSSSEILFCQFYEYDRNLIKVGPIIRRFIYGLSLYILLNTVKNLLLYVKK